MQDKIGGIWFTEVKGMQDGVCLLKGGQMQGCWDTVECWIYAYLKQ